LGVEVVRSDPRDNVPGRRIAIPEHPAQVAALEVDLDRVRRSYLRNAVEALPTGVRPDPGDVDFLAAETGTSADYVEKVFNVLERKTG
jgi:hypothetical protein